MRRGLWPVRRIHARHLVLRHWFRRRVVRWPAIALCDRRVRAVALRNRRTWRCRLVR